MIPLSVFVLSLLAEFILLGAYCVWLQRRQEVERAALHATHATERAALLNRLMARDLPEYQAFAQGRGAPPPANELAHALAQSERDSYGFALDAEADADQS